MALTGRARLWFGSVRSGVQSGLGFFSKMRSLSGSSSVDVLGEEFIFGWLCLLVRGNDLSVVCHAATCVLLCKGRMQATSESE